MCCSAWWLNCGIKKQFSWLWKVQKPYLGKVDRSTTFDGWCRPHSLILLKGSISAWVRVMWCHREASCIAKTGSALKKVKGKWKYLYRAVDIRAQAEFVSQIFGVAACGIMSGEAMRSVCSQSAFATQPFLFPCPPAIVQCSRAWGNKIVKKIW